MKKRWESNWIGKKIREDAQFYRKYVKVGVHF